MWLPSKQPDPEFTGDYQIRDDFRVGFDPNYPPIPHPPPKKIKPCNYIFMYVCLCIYIYDTYVCVFLSSVLAPKKTKPPKLTPRPAAAKSGEIKSGSKEIGECRCNLRLSGFRV